MGVPTRLEVCIVMGSLIYCLDRYICGVPCLFTRGPCARPSCAPNIKCSARTRRERPAAQCNKQERKFGFSRWCTEDISSSDSSHFNLSSPSRSCPEMSGTTVSCIGRRWGGQSDERPLKTNSIYVHRCYSTVLVDRDRVQARDRGVESRDG